MGQISIFARTCVVLCALFLITNVIYARPLSTTYKQVATLTPPATLTPLPTSPPPVPTPHPCEGQIPDVPKLKSPADGATIPKGELVLRWSKANCALRLRIRIAQDQPDGKTIILLKDWFGNKAELSIVKPGNYKWRVSGCFRGVCGKRSPWRHFTIVP